MTVRTLAGPDLAQALADAQASFVAGSAAEDTWRLPPGRFAIPMPLTLGAAKRGLALEGNDTELVFTGITGTAISLTGSTVRAEGLSLSVTAAADSTALTVIAGSAVLADLSVSLSATGAAQGIVVTATGIDVQRCGVTGLTATGAATGLRLAAQDALFLRDVSATGLTGATATGLDLSAARIAGGELSVGTLHATGQAIGIRATATVDLTLEDIAADGLHGAGADGRPFDDETGDGVTALRAAAPDGRLERLTLSGLVASSGRAVPVRAAAGIVVADISHQRALTGADLPALLAAAQAALADTPAGTLETWQLPAGDFTLTAGLSLGVAGRSITLRGSRQAGLPTRLRFHNGGGPIAGDLTCLTLTGDAVGLDAVALSADASGALTALAATATSLRLTDIGCSDLSASTVTGIAATVTTADLSDVTVTNAHASAGVLTGVRVTADAATLANLSISNVTATAQATGIDVVGRSRLAASTVATRDLSGQRAAGLRLRVLAADGELSVLDATASGINTVAGQGDAIGIALASAGDIDIRGLSVGGITGSRATGLLAAAGRSFDWMGGDVGPVQSLDRGAAGVRCVATPAAPQSAAAPSVAIRGVAIEAISGAVPGTQPDAPLTWSEAVEARLAALLADDGLDTLPTTADPDHVEDIAGLIVLARVTPFETWIDRSDPGSVVIENTVIRRVSGSALQVGAALRDIGLRGCEIWTAIRGGWIEGERVLLANLTMHRLQAGLDLGPGEFSVFNTLVTGITAGPGLNAGPDTELADASQAAFVQDMDVPFRPPPNPLPYIDPGPSGALPAAVLAGGLAAADPVDLRLTPGTTLHAEARPIPGDPPDSTVFVGCHPPETDTRCVLHDPLAPPPASAPAPPEPGPFVDYRARDAQALLAVMMDRARTTMLGWSERSAPDMTTMLMELLAYRLDQLAYAQESAVAEGFFGTARRQRSVEDHARLVDYVADPGLSATAMLRFWFTDAGKVALGLRERFDRGETFAIPRDTLVVNPDFDDVSIIFATETELAYDEQLEALSLYPGDDLAAGAVSMVLAGDLVDRIRPGRWLVISHDDPSVPSHVIRAVQVEFGTDSTRIVWDPRRPAPAVYPVDATTIYGNVVPAQHGVPVTPLDPGYDLAAATDTAGLTPWREQMRLTLDNSDGTIREIAVPLGPVSVQSPGWPLPDQTGRTGTPALEFAVDDEPWRLVDDLSLAQPADPAFVLRAGAGGGSVVRVGDGGNGLALPRRPLQASFSARIGLGTQGNVGAGALRRIVAFGTGGDIEALIAGSEDQRLALQQALQVRNDLPAIGGRDPEPMARIRYRAPRLVRDTLSAVSAADYERLLNALPEVAGTRAAVIDAGLRHLIRVVLLLRDEDQLTLPELGADAEAERLRRWALVRSRLEAIRLLGWDVELLPPSFVPLDIDLTVDAEPWAQAEMVRHGVVAALSGDGGLFDPDTSGLGGDVHVDALHRAALSVPGVAALRVQRLRRLQPHAIDYAEAGTLPIAEDEVAVLRRPYGTPDGLLTVTVCGGLP
ncbi:MAG: hypothetical protein U1E70_14905 [Acetobacteraceae bacterium]